MVIQEKQYTLAEFHTFAERPENKNRLFELINGEIVEKVASFTPSRIAMRMGHLFATYLDQHDIGYLTGADGSYIPHPAPRAADANADDIGYLTGADGSYILSPGYEVMPDVGYIAKERLPHEPAREVEGPPDLAVEVKSPTDSKRELRQKAEVYLRFGTKMVWLVFPEEQRVEVYVPDEDVREFDISGVLDGDNVLPGFTLAVREIFPQ